MMEFARAVDNALEPLRDFANNLGAPLFDLAARLYVSYAFFKSGMIRLGDLINGNFDNQIFLFELEHPVPGLEPELAAYMATAGEIFLPILLGFGLFGRFAAVGILIMTAIIEFTYVHSAHHILWAFLAASIFIKGPGAYSVDAIIKKYMLKP